MTPVLTGWLLNWPGGRKVEQEASPGPWVLESRLRCPVRRDIASALLGEDDSDDD